MAPPTLVGMAQRNLIRNLPALQDVGDAPYELVKPALRKVADPQQLRTIEVACPHIADADAELWMAFIKRDVPNWKDKLVTPSNPRSWWKVYRKLYREEQAAQEEQKKQIKEAMKEKQAEKEANQTNLLNTVVKQKFRQRDFFDGHANPRTGAYDIERVGTVANAKKSGRSIIASIRKAATKPSYVKPAEKGVETSQPKIWQRPVSEPGVRRKEPPNLMRRGAPTTMIEKTTKSAFDRAMRAEEKIRGERAKQTSNSPPPLTATSPSANPQTVKPTAATSTSLVTAASPPLTASQLINATGAAPLGPGAGSKRPLSPEKPSPAAPPQKRARPTTSIFMPKRPVKR